MCQPVLSGWCDRWSEALITMASFLTLEFPYQHGIPYDNRLELRGKSPKWLSAFEDMI